VIVADPAFSQRLFPALDPLPAARSDAESMRTMFKESVALVGAEATPRAVKSAGRNCDVLHVAAHAFSSTRDASLSLIAMAPDDGDEGLLRLEDIESLSLARRPLVVLAGCQTGTFGGGKGSIRSVAHSFLAAGSRAVLASLWDVGDEATSQLTARFYRAIAEGRTFPAALRDAQLASIRTRPPAEWAAFQIYSGIAGERGFIGPSIQ
jgi:CHAT domain-containing protein